MKSRVILMALAAAFVLGAQVYAQCGPCDPACDPCGACNTYTVKRCDLFSGLKSLLACKPYRTVSCDPCVPVVNCSSCDVSACDPCGNGPTCDPCGPAACHCGNCGTVPACDPCGNGPACDPCDPCGTVGACNPCGTYATYASPCVPIKAAFKKAGYGFKRLFNNIFSCKQTYCGPCGPACHCGNVGACDPCGNVPACDPCGRGPACDPCGAACSCR